MVKTRIVGKILILSVVALSLLNYLDGGSVIPFEILSFLSVFYTVMTWKPRSLNSRSNRALVQAYAIAAMLVVVAISTLRGGFSLGLNLLVIGGIEVIDRLPR